MSSSSSYAEKRDWFNHVKRTFNREFENNIVAEVCVFQVPKSLRSVNPEAYLPQLVGLGPYHHLHPKLLEMERIKVVAAKRVHKGFDHANDFPELSQKLAKLDQYVRACYHKFLPMDTDVLAWIMAVDALFLFDLFCRHATEKSALKSSEYLRELAFSPGRKLAEDAIIRDVMMLENQIPIFVLEKVLTLECSEPRIAQEILPKMLVGFCEALSPIKINSKYSVDKALKRAHLLDLLYHMIVHKEGEFKIEIPKDIIADEEDQFELKLIKASSSQVDLNEATTEPDQTRISAMLDAISEVNMPFMKKIKPHIEFVQALLKLPISDFNSTLSFRSSGAPVAGNILIPTASLLSRAGIKFRETRSIQGIRFEEETATLFLPVVKLGVKSEVVIRNLVAYEAMAMSGSLIFARYIELMDGIIDTEEDVKLLIESKIIISHLKEREVAKLFNGMSKSIELSGHSELDEAIKRVKNFYNGSLNVKAGKMLEKYLYRFWKILVVLGSLFLLVLMALQTFCSAYNCPHHLNISNNSA